MNEADIPIDIHTLKLQDWLVSRRIVPKTIQKNIRDIRTKISNALQDMPANDQLIKLLSGTNINYYHCKEIVEILKQTEKDTKSVFGTYGSQRMKDWQEILRFYEKDNVYLAEAAQIYVRNVNYEIPGVRKQMTKLEQQSDECLKRVHDLGKPEAQLLAEHALLLQQLGIKGENLREEFLQVLGNLPGLYENSIRNIGKLQEAINLFSEGSEKPCLPILRYLIEFGNTTVYQYVHKEAPLTIEEPAVKLNLSDANAVAIAASDNEIDFGGDDNGGTSSTISAEIIDFGEFTFEDNNSPLEEEDAVNLDENSADIDWGIESEPSAAVEINFDIPIEEYGIVVEGAGMDGGIAKGEQAFTILDSPSYRDRFLDEIYELEAFLCMRLYELNQLDTSSNIMFSLMDSISTYDAVSIRKMLTNIEQILGEICSEQTRHLFQLKHSPKYADLLATKLKQMMKAVDKIRDTKEVLKKRSIELMQQRVDLNPVLAELVSQTKKLQLNIENDISKRYKNRIVNLIGGVN
ncbi:CDK5RAP3-like protein isoform X1 [Anastrepha ludens]|uniref:CDK5RAP3-like protein isoform X1 n=1 Tax=Anastrepha ludens TaxID=28586 RepID=UPI0023AF6DEF|nr:CDK5RAP3-like protein isoform X1 [Anastrepha ludens]